MIIPWKSRWPELHETAWIAPSADVIGDVTLGAHSSVWFQVVIRGDVNSIRIGSRTNIQDHSLLHVTRPSEGRANESRGGAALTVGDEVTIGHRVTLHGCTVGNRVLIGMGAIVMDGAEIADECLIGAGALITQGMKIPSGSVVMGSPAKVVRELRPEERTFLARSAANYVKDSSEYMSYLRGPARFGKDNRDLEELEGEHTE